jgi:hypothetical protein
LNILPNWIVDTQLSGRYSRLKKINMHTEGIGSYDSCFYYYIHHQSRVKLFSAIFQGLGVEKVQGFYTGMADILVPDHDYEVANHMMLAAGLVPPHAEDFNRTRALQIFELDKNVGLRFLDRGKNALADLIEDEQGRELEYKLMLKKFRNGRTH